MLICSILEIERKTNEFMIFIICAMKCEASPIISMLKLMPDEERNWIYTGDGYHLVITGVGEKNVRDKLAGLPMPVNRKTDIFINIGVCGCVDESYPLGSVFLIDEIHYENGSIPYYPDLLVKSDIPSAGCTTYSKVKTDRDCPTLLAEMEAFAFYSECLRYVKSDRIHLLKIVSDYMVLSELTKNDISGFVHKSRSLINKFIAALREYPEETAHPDYSNYYDLYKFTTSIRTELDRLNMYYFYKHGNFPGPDIYEETKEPSNKKESLKIYHDIEKQLI